MQHKTARCAFTQVKRAGFDMQRKAMKSLKPQL